MGEGFGSPAGVQPPAARPRGGHRMRLLRGTLQPARCRQVCKALAGLLPWRASSASGCAGAGSIPRQPQHQISAGRARAKSAVLWIRAHQYSLGLRRFCMLAWGKAPEPKLSISPDASILRHFRSCAAMPLSHPLRVPACRPPSHRRTGTRAWIITRKCCEIGEHVH